MKNTSSQTAYIITVICFYYGGKHTKHAANVDGIAVIYNTEEEALETVLEMDGQPTHLAHNQYAEEYRVTQVNRIKLPNYAR